ncbi:MAG: trimethylamine methyltransferase family protein, partial [Firmicutes bacterium]|nr:trimethylamine methyltransferase family protein [Bacillota bacterium]
MKLKPRYQLLEQNDMEKIHETSLRILEEVGIFIAYEPAREILKKHGAKEEGKTIYFPRTLVEERLKTVPSEFTVYSRDPKKSIHMNTEDTFYSGPGCSAYVSDLDLGRRYSKLDDFINIVKIVHSLPNIDIHHEIACEPNDVDVELRPAVMTYNNLKYSDKPFLGSSLGYENAKRSIEMTAIAHGGLDVLKEKTVLFSIPCSLTPLGYDEKMAGAIVAYAETNQAQIINSLPIAGATGPATYAGSMALQNAEILAGIVLAQCVNPGCPVVYSPNGASADMATGSMVAGGPEYAVFALANGQMAKFYNIPCRVAGSLTDSKMMDSQAAFESAIGCIMGQLAGGNFVLGGAGFLETYNCTSYEKLVIDNEIIG